MRPVLKSLLIVAIATPILSIPPAASALTAPPPTRTAAAAPATNCPGSIIDSHSPESGVILRLYYAAGSGGRNCVSVDGLAGNPTTIRLIICNEGSPGAGCTTFKSATETYAFNGDVGPLTQTNGRCVRIRYDVGGPRDRFYGPYHCAG